MYQGRTAPKGDIKREPRISLRCSRGIPCCRCESKLCALGTFVYDTYTIFLGGAYVNAGDVESHIEDTLNHEWMHAVLFKLFDRRVAENYDNVYHLVEPKGRVILMW